MSELRDNFDYQTNWYDDPEPPRHSRRRRRIIARVLIAFALVAVVAIFVEVVLVAYDRHDEAGGEGVAPLVRADLRPTRVRPDQPGGLQVPHQDRLVLQDTGRDNGPMAVVTLRPPPEQPVEALPAETAVVTGGQEAGQPDPSAVAEREPVEAPREAPAAATAPEPSETPTGVVTAEDDTVPSLAEPDRQELAELVAEISDSPVPSGESASLADQDDSVDAAGGGTIEDDTSPAPAPLADQDDGVDAAGAGTIEENTSPVPPPMTSGEAEVLIPRPEATAPPLALRTGPLLPVEQPAEAQPPSDSSPAAYDQPLALTRRMGAPEDASATAHGESGSVEVMALGTFAAGPITEEALADYAVEDRAPGLVRIVPPPAAGPSPAVAPMAEGGHRVQLAAYDSESKARSQWDWFVQEFPDLLGNLEPTMPTVQVGGQTWHRLQAGPLDEAGARRLCAALQARGADCLVR